ncbi:hypothetical protein P9939_27110, partial [Serratia nevei]|uniref:hypothetical protein n=1 Tax=Serratia nevei TaxID=2703794 RepID=UPI00254A194B
SAILWKPPAHSPEENMVRQKCSGIRRSYLDESTGILFFSPFTEKAFSVRDGMSDEFILYPLFNIYCNTSW